MALCFISVMFNLLQSSANEQLLEKLLCNQSNHYEIFGSAKMNGTQKGTLVSPLKMHCADCGTPKGTFWVEVRNVEQQKNLHIELV